MPRRRYNFKFTWCATYLVLWHKFGTSFKLILWWLVLWMTSHLAVVGHNGDAWLVALRYRDGVWIVLGMESKDFYRASICKGGLCSRNSVCTSVCSSVCLSHAWIVTNLNVHCRYFDTTRKGNHSATRPKSGWWATPPSLWNLRSNWPTPLRKTPTSTGFRS